MLIDLNKEDVMGDRIRRWIQGYLKVPSLEGYDIVFTNGADAAIHAVAHSILAGKNVDCFDLNYSYASTMLAEAASHVTQHATKWDLEAGVRTHERQPLTADVIYVTNPDNRFGLTFDSMPVTERSDAVLIIDESYGDFEDSDPSASLDGRTLHIRTFSKFFDLEKQRIAYILGPTQLMQQVRKMVPQYAIATSSIIQLDKIVTFSSSDSVTERRDEIISWKKGLYALLNSHKLTYARSHTDFVTILNASPEELAQLGLNGVETKSFAIRGDLYTRLRRITTPLYAEPICQYRHKKG